MVEKPKPEVKKKEKSKPEIKPKKEKKHYFPKLLILFGLVLAALSIISYLKYYNVPRLVLEIVSLLAGLWFIKIGISKGFYKKRKEIFKKYI
tara:strand:- start:1199 stop:1474 length:276 start_codon:yes stop_codon:yes gene_type:complete